jgi:Mrp family chromosome partitioning ATPase
MQEVRVGAAKRLHRDANVQAAESLRNEIADAIVGSELLSKMEDSFRQLAARCFDEALSESQMLAVSSSSSGAGTSAVALGLAAGAVENLGADTLVIETNLSSPRLAKDLGVQASVGLSDYLSRDVDVAAVVSPTPSPRLWLLPAGRPVHNPGPYVRSEKFRQLLANLRALRSNQGGPAFRTIILDTPPLLTSPDAKVIAQQADGIVLIVSAGETHAHDIKAALRLAGETPVRGIVLNRTRSWLPSWISRVFGLSRFDFE